MSVENHALNDGPDPLAEVEPNHEVIDVDLFQVELEPGDIFGAIVDGGATHLTLRENNASLVDVTSSYVNLSKAYRFKGFAGSQIQSLQNLPPGGGVFQEPSLSSASFELWFKPDADGDADVLLETGANGDGTSLTYDGATDTVTFRVKDGPTVRSVSASGFSTNEFSQLVAVYDKDIDAALTDEITLYVNGVAGGSATATTLDDWAGGDPSGLAAIGGSGINFDFPESSAFTPFEGELSILRFYESALDAGQVVGNFDAVESDSPSLDTSYTLNYEASQETDSIWNDLVGTPDQLGNTNRFDFALTASRELIGSDQDLSFAHPLASPLPGGGNAALSYVIDSAGSYTLAVDEGSGDYTLNLRAFRPQLESQRREEQQILFLDFDGADVPQFGNPNADLSPLSDFLGGWGLLPSDEAAVIDSIVAVVEENYADVGLFGNNGNFDSDGIDGNYGITVLNSRDHADPFGNQNVSRVVVGGTIGELGIGTIGIAESIDVGNFETEETGVVLLDLLSAPANNPNSLNQYPIATGFDIIDLIGVGVGNIVAHEAGHFFANWHTNQFNAVADIMDQGGNLPGLIGLGIDRIFGTSDDVDVDFGRDQYVPNEGFTGTENTLNAIAFGLSTGTVDTGQRVISSDPSDGELVRAAAPSTFVLSVLDPVDQATVQASDMMVNGTPADAVRIDSSGEVLTFEYATSPAIQGPGNVIRVAENAFTRSFDDDGVEAYSATFNYDAILIEPVTIDPADGSVVEQPFTSLVVEFNEPYREGSIGTDDLILSDGSVTGFQFVDETTVPLEAKAPLGSLIYDPSVSGTISGSIANADGFESGSLDGQWSTFSSFIPFVNSLQVADDLVSGVLPSLSFSDTIGQADLNDPTNGWLGDWSFDNVIPGGGGDDYTVRTTGTLQVNTAGTFSFDLSGDDGGRLRIDGVDVVVENALGPFRNAFGEVTLDAGTHTFEWLGFERAGGAAFELSLDDPDFHVKFQQYDNFPIPTDGRGWDDISIEVPSGDVDSFTVDVDPGQTISVIVDGDDRLRAEVELLLVEPAPGRGDPNRPDRQVPLATAQASEKGGSAVIQTVRTLDNPGVNFSGPRSYLIRVSGAGETFGSYETRIVLNALVEEESVGGGSNGSRAGAEDLEPSVIGLSEGPFGFSVGDPVAGKPGRAAALGRLEQVTETVPEVFEDVEPFAEQDVYQLDLKRGETATFTANALSGGDVNLELLDEAGNVVAAGLSVGEELVVNGSFETGDFSGWTVETTAQPFRPWRVSGGGIGGGFGFAPTEPQDGDFVAWNGFDGQGPMEFTVNGAPSSSARFGANGPGTTTHTDDPGIVGPTRGVLGLTFDQPVGELRFGIALSTTATVPEAASVRLLDENSIEIGVFNVAAEPGDFFFTSGLFVYDGSTPVSRAEVSYNSAAAGASIFDNLVFATAPEPASDFYRIETRGNRRLVIETRTPARGGGEFVNGLDPVIRLYDSGGRPVATGNAVGKHGAESRLVYQVPRGGGGTYYVEVTSSEFGGELTSGEYILSVRGNELRPSGLVASSPGLPASAVALLSQTAEDSSALSRRLDAEADDDGNADAVATLTSSVNGSESRPVFDRVHADWLSNSSESDDDAEALLSLLSEDQAALV